MNKSDILEILSSFPYDRKEYWLITGGAMVLYGFRDETGDIDLGCSGKMADRLEADGFLTGITDNGKRRFRVGEKIEVFEDWLEDSLVTREGFQVLSVNGLLAMKQGLGREKDLRDIELINERRASMKHIIAVNAGPRKGWNTDLLIRRAAEGAESAGAEVEIVDLYSLSKFTGCRSCFGCKREPNIGRCVIQDGLSDVLEKIRNADGLIIGSPNYLGELTAQFRAIYERLVFQSLTYNREQPCCNERQIPALLIMTSNAPDGAYDALLQRYKGTLDRFVGPCRVLAAGNTLQVDDYSIYNWTMFNPEDKKKSREEAFPEKLEQAFELGKAMV